MFHTSNDSQWISGQLRSKSVKGQHDNNYTFNISVEKTFICIWVWESFAIKPHGLWVETVLKFQYRYSVYTEMGDRKKKNIADTFSITSQFTMTPTFSEKRWSQIHKILPPCNLKNIAFKAIQWSKDSCFNEWCQNNQSQLKI